MKSAAGTEYRIFVAAPPAPEPGLRLRVVYMLDGNRMFPLAVASAEANGTTDMVLVGIGYPTEDRAEIVRRRYFDLTPPTPADLIPGGDRRAPRTGGNDSFLTFIEEELKPEIARRFPIDPTRQTLFGHSLGGLLVLHTLFTRTEAFQTYVAADPSIWWDGHSILTELEAYIGSVAAEGAGPRVLIETAGQKSRRAAQDPRTMNRLRTLRSGPGGEHVYRKLREAGQPASYRPMPDQSHGSMIPPAVEDMLRFSGRDEEPVR